MGAAPSNSGSSALGPVRAGVGAPLFHAAWLFALGIVISHLVLLRPAYLLLALAPVACLCVIATLRMLRAAWLPLAFLWCLLGAWCGEMQPQPAPAPMLAPLTDGLLRTVEGTIINAGPMREEVAQDLDAGNETAQMQRLDLQISSVEVVTDEEDALRAMQGGVRLTVRWPDGDAPASRIDCGDRVRVDAQLTRPEVYRDPGAWNRRDYLLDQGITATATVKPDRIAVIEPAKEPSFACRVAGWQHAGSAKILALPAAMSALPASLRLSEDDAIMLAAMVTGDRTYLTHALRVGFERTGSFHMLVVSGLHLAIVAGLIFLDRAEIARAASASDADDDCSVMWLRSVHGIRDAGAAFALDGDALSSGPAGISRAKRAEHHRICVALFASGKSEEPV